MKLSKFKKKNIFCIEGNWGNSHRDKRSISAALEFLKVNLGIDPIRKDCSTPEQFNRYLQDSLKRVYKTYGIIYLAFHGSPGKLHIGNRNKIDFDSIAETLNGEAKDKIIHFGSCSTLHIPGRALTSFRKKTGAIVVSGYTTDVDFIESTVLDILYFRICQNYNRIPLIDRDMKAYYGKLVRELGFKMNFEK